MFLTTQGAGEGPCGLMRLARILLVYASGCANAADITAWISNTTLGSSECKLTCRILALTIANKTRSASRGSGRRFRLRAWHSRYTGTTRSWAALEDRVG